MMRSLLAALLILASDSTSVERSFIVKNNSFVKDGKVLQLRSGSMHYARVPRAYWKDRLQRLQAMGLNAISTYVPWNWHEEEEGKFNFDGDHDLAGFLQTANEVGMMVLLRAGPYICGEWEFGGLPAWILTHNVTIRTFEPNYIALVDKWWAKLLSEVKPMLYSAGGSVVMLQVENEFGSYGNVATRPSDKQYIEHLVSITNAALGEGSVQLYTTDGGNSGSMSRGSLNGSSVLTTGDGRWACSAQAEFNPPGLNACTNSEDYTGWLTHWGENMANRSASTDGVNGALAAGNSFNLYMGHGGTNFGWMSGANGGGKGYKAHITSYDYNSPVSENGDHGVGKNGHDKFEALLNALLPYAPPGGFPKEPAPLPRTAYGEVKLTEKAEMLSDENLRILDSAGPRDITIPMSMEALGQNYGFVHYTAGITAEGSTLAFEDYPRDRAQIFVDGAYQGSIYRPDAAPLKLKSSTKSGAKLGLLVENMGRLNFGRSMTDPKGILSEVTLDESATAFENWQAWTLPLKYSEVTALKFSALGDKCSALSGPTFLKGVLNIAGKPTDTYLKPKGFTKGMMWVNGFNLGRYWEPQGPQHAFYLPAPYLQTGANDVVMLELEQGADNCTVVFDDQPDFSASPSPGPSPTPEKCDGTPKAGDVLVMRTCDSSILDHQGWTMTNTSSGVQLSIGGLCLTVGSKLDSQSHKPSAQLAACDDAAELTVGPSTVVETKGGTCLDITANGKEPGEPVEWYKCNGLNNQGFTLQDTPAHTSLLISSMDQKCLSACSASTGETLFLI